MENIENGKKFFILIEDQNGNITYPTNQNDLKNVKDVLECNNNSTNLIQINSNWFEKSTNVNPDGLKQTIIVDITEHVIDPLTNIFKFKYFESLLAEYIEHAASLKEPFSIVMADIDNLKKINNTYGHHIGDQVLSRIGETFINSFRIKDPNNDITEKRKASNICQKDIIFTRVHGDEFAILLPNITLEESKIKIANVKQDIADLTFDVEGISLNLASMSFGIFHIDQNYYKNNSDNSPEFILKDILNQSDKEMYKAKSRNKGITYVYGTNQEEQSKNI